ncbi:MAG: hypothetical protein RLZ98_1855 [Pseudomonadota bacterium]|jgi:hypothetical protein
MNYMPGFNSSNGSDGQTGNQSAVPDAMPQQLQDLIDAGRFAEYHLEKARMAVATGDYRQAKYQVEASMCHGRMPEAVALRSEIKRLIKANK